MTDTPAQPPPPPEAPGPAHHGPAGAPNFRGPPRAFAQGTGVLLQGVGMVLFLSTCCLCYNNDKWDPPLSPKEAQKKLDQNQDIVSTFGQVFRDPATAGLSMMVVFSNVGGLALAVFGLGLQTDKPKAAWAAAVTAAIWLMLMVAAGVCLWVGGGGWFIKLWNVLLTLVALVVLGFTVAALKQVRADPPPPGLDVLPPDFEIPRGYRH